MTRRHWRTDDHRVEFDRLLDLFRALEAEGAEYVLDALRRSLPEAAPEA